MLRTFLGWCVANSFTVCFRQRSPFEILSFFSRYFFFFSKFDVVRKQGCLWHWYGNDISFLQMLTECTSEWTNNLGLNICLCPFISVVATPVLAAYPIPSYTWGCFEIATLCLQFTTTGLHWPLQSSIFQVKIAPTKSFREIPHFRNVSHRNASQNCSSRHNCQEVGKTTMIIRISRR